MKKIFKLEIFVFFVTFILRIYYISLPYSRDLLAAGSTNFWQVVGENYLRYGYLSHWSCPVLNTGSNLPPELYFNHPSLTAFYLSLFYWVLGASSLVTKFAALVGWYTVSYLIFKLASKKSVSLGHYSLIASLILPFTNIFSNCMDSIGGPLIVVFSLLFIYFLENKSNAILISLAIVLAVFSEWSFIPLAIYCGIAQRYKSRRLLIWTVSLSAYTLLTFLFFYHSKHDFLQMVQLHIAPHQGFTVPVLHLLSKIVITYVLTLFTPFLFIGGFLLFKKYKFTYLSLLMQPLIMVLAFPHGAYKHAFWVCTLVPFACLAIAQSMKVFKKYKLFIVFGILIFSVAYTIYFKGRGHTNYYMQAGQFINLHTSPKEIVLIPTPGMAADANSERLLIGSYAKRDLIMLPKEEDKVAKYFWSCSVNRCKSQVINTKES